MITVRQDFPDSPVLDVRAEVQRGFAGIKSRLKPGARIAVGVGSRGITNLSAIVAEVIAWLKAARVEPFIVPAMGSHGGATPEGQTALLAEYGVSEKTLGVPVRAAMDARQIGTTEEGLPVFFSEAALAADGIVVVNRVKPHTDFLSDTTGSGLIKMLVVGLGKRLGAAHYHLASSRFGYERVLHSSVKVTLRSVPLLCGVAIVENQTHQTARIEVVRPDETERREGELFAEAKRLMPRLPFDDIDLLIVDRIGKNISGTGMDTNIIGRGVHSYSTALGDRNAAPHIGRIFVRDLTSGTHGNGIGIGLADFTTTRLLHAMDHKATAINALTSLTPHGAKVPMHFDTDREAIAAALATLGLDDPRRAKVARIADTLSLETLQGSEALAQQARDNPSLTIEGALTEMRFDASGNLPPM
jgi:hypothetical protein